MTSPYPPPRFVVRILEEHGAPSAHPAPLPPGATTSTCRDSVIVLSARVSLSMTVVGRFPDQRLYVATRSSGVVAPTAITSGYAAANRAAVAEQRLSPPAPSPPAPSPPAPSPPAPSPPAPSPPAPAPP